MIADTSGVQKYKGSDSSEVNDTGGSKLKKGTSQNGGLRGGTANPPYFKLSNQ
jgi:hypothetical protein